MPFMNTPSNLPYALTALLLTGLTFAMAVTALASAGLVALWALVLLSYLGGCLAGLAFWLVMSLRHQP